MSNVSVASEAYGTGTSTTVTATLSWTGNGTAPIGGLSFSSTAAGSFGSANCSGTTSPISCTATFAPTATDAAGSYTLSGTFLGDSHYGTASSTQTNNFSIVQQTPTVAVTNVSVASEAYGTGTSTTVTATLSWTGNGTAPIGGLSFSSTAAGSFGSANCSGTTSPISCSATFTPTATDAAGSYTLSGTFLGDSHYGTASSTQTNNFSIVQQTPTVAVTNVSVASEAYGTGTSTTVTATLSWTGNGAAPSGGLSFSSTAAGSLGPTNCSGTTSPISCTATFAPTATDGTNNYTLGATFLGDAHYGPANSTQSNNFSIVRNTSISLSITNVSLTQGATTPVSVSTLVSWTGGGSAPSAADVNIGFVGSGTSIGGSVGSTSCGAASGDSMTCSAMYTPSGTLAGGAYTSPSYNTLKVAFSGDSNYVSANSAADTVAVSQSPAITSASSTTFTAGTPGLFTVTATGFPTPSITENGGLPAGVTFVDNHNGTGTLSGTPASGGLFSISFTAMNGVGSNAMQTFTLTVNQPPVFTSANSATFTIGVAGSFTVTASGSPAPSITEAGHLPSGLTFVDNGNGKGSLSGTPTVFIGGDFTITLTAKNGIGSPVTETFTIIVQQPPAFTSPNNAVFAYGVPSSFTVTTAAFPNASINESGTLPPWLTFVDNGNGTATLSGTPTFTSGTFPLVLTATNVVTSTQQNFTLSVSGLNLSPSNLVFGTVYLNSSHTLPVAVTNVGSTAISITGVSITPGTANGAAYTAVNHCTSPLKAGKSCIIDVTFKANAEGTLTATLNLTDNAVGMPQQVELTGNVIDPVAQFSPATLPFGTQTVHSSTTLPVQLTNSGQTPLDISNIAIGGTNAGDFSQTNNCPAILSSTMSCTISVAFDPTVKGVRAAMLIVTDNMASGQSTVALTGKGK